MKKFWKMDCITRQTDTDKLKKICKTIFLQVSDIYKQKQKNKNKNFN